MHSGARTAFKTLIVAGLLLFTIAYHVRRFPMMKNGIDFPEFYCASKMVLAGAGHQLYDLSAQQHFQAQHTGRIGVLYNHPPFEILVYLASALLPYDRGYLLWTVVSAILLAFCALLLNRSAQVFRDSGLLIMVFFVFAPVELNFLQGQDLSLLLLVYVLLYRALRGDRMFTAGALLACGLFKPHLVLPCFLILLLVRRSWRFLAGFALAGAVLGGISLAISGWRAVLAYPSFVLSLSHVRIAGYSPHSMANWRGLLSLVLSSSLCKAVLLVSGSAVLFGVAILGWGKAGSEQKETAEFDLAFGNTMVITLLLSYQLSPHDLTLLLLPIALALRHLRESGVGRDWLRIGLASLLLILYLPVLYIFVLMRHTYAWLAVPMLLLSVSLWLEARRMGAHAHRPVQVA